MKIKLLNPPSIPKYQTEDSAGFDIESNEEITIVAGERALVRTGLFMAIPSGYEVQIRPRSGLALKNGITVLNTPGTIDADYRGEVGIILMNHSKNDFLVKKGDRIAQGVLTAVFHASFQNVEDLNETGRTGGYGSTGI